MSELLNHAETLTYVLLIILGISSLSLWLHSVYLLSLSDMMPEEFVTEIRDLLANKKYDRALNRCKKEDTLSAHMLAKGIEARRQGIPLIINAMETEEKKCENLFWERVQTLKNIAVTAPLLGLLGAVMSLIFSSNESLLESLLVSLGLPFLGGLLGGISYILSSSLKTRIHSLLNTILTETLIVVKSAKID